MCADISTSVSKGCFAYKGKRKRARQENYLPPTDSFVKSRFNSYEEQWDLLQVQIDILKSDLNTQIFDGLVTFLQSCHNQNECEEKIRSVGEIPTAVLITGVNTPDHSVMFSNLESILKSSVSPFIVRLLSKDCGKLNALIRSLVSQLTNVVVDDDENEDGEEGSSNKQENSAESPIKFKKSDAKTGRKGVSLMSVVKWYNKTLQDLSGSVNKSFRNTSSVELDDNGVDECDSNIDTTEKSSLSSAEKKKPLIVIVLEDVENIAAKVLQDFISICSTYLTRLPIVFVLGVATSVSALHQLLPSSVSSLLCMDMFQAPPASSYLTSLMDRIIMSADVSFKLGPKVFHFFLDNFLFHNFSIMNFTLGFQYCMMEHFIQNPLSILCCSPEDVENVVSGLSHAQLKLITKQDSFKQLVQVLPDPDNQSMVLSSEAATKGFLQSSLSSFHTRHTEMFAVMRYLHSLASSLPRYPLGKQFRELYSLCIRENVCETDEFLQASSLLRMMSREELTTTLDNSISVLVDVKKLTPGVRKVYKSIKRMMKNLKALDEERILQEEMEQESDASQRILPQRAKLHDLKETLLSMSSRRKKSPYERMREDIVDTLVSHFSEYLSCPTKHPLHTVFYFNDLNSVKNNYRAAPRLYIQQALTQPSKYLNCKCCQFDAEAIVPTMPDICIVYKLHLECGTLVNLFDWMQAFTMVVTQDATNNGAKKSKKMTKKPGTEYHARFIRAVSELEFLGFIKATRRKTDHVAKLTW